MNSKHMNWYHTTNIKEYIVYIYLLTNILKILSESFEAEFE